MKKLSKKWLASIVAIVAMVIFCAIPTLAYSTFKSSEIVISPSVLHAGDIVFSDCVFVSLPSQTVRICYCDSLDDAIAHKYSGGEVLEFGDSAPCDTTCYLPDGSVGTVDLWIVYECVAPDATPGIDCEVYFYPCPHDSVTATKIDEHSLTATCKICGMSGTVSITASDAEYDGTPKEATVEGADFFAEEPLINYVGTDNDYESPEAPTNAGKYVVKLSYRNSEEVEISAAFEITSSETPEEPPTDPTDPTEPSEPEPTVPETGDASYASLYAFIAILSVALMLFALGCSKKKN